MTTSTPEPVLRHRGGRASSAFASRAACSQSGRAVIGIDNVNDYYDPALKEARLAKLQEHRGFAFHRLDLADRAATEKLFGSGRFRFVVHLAAQAGVRYSLQNPHAYLDANLAGFLNVLEGCRQRRHAASDLCLVELGLRRQYQAAVLGARQCRSSGEPLRRDQEGQ